MLARQKLWDQQDAEWQHDRQAHQQRVVELEDWFTKQLTATEQNALRALNELDSAWQRDKQQWHESAIGREKESRDRETAWLKEQRTGKTRIRGPGSTECRTPPGRRQLRKPSAPNSRRNV